jgi:hypothetical protein
MTPLLSFPRRRESRRFGLNFWIPACAGMTCNSKSFWPHAGLSSIPLFRLSVFDLIQGAFVLSPIPARCAFLQILAGRQCREFFGERRRDELVDRNSFLLRQRLRLAVQRL